jgi:hypothetical protein
MGSHKGPIVNRRDIPQYHSDGGAKKTGPVNLMWHLLPAQPRLFLCRFVSWHSIASPPVSVNSRRQAATFAR